MRESFLADGDILAIAETEVTFIASSVTPLQRMATQPIHPRESSKPPAQLASEITAMRALMEATLWQAIPLQFETAVSLTSGESEASFAHGVETMSGLDPELLAVHAVGQHYRELSRRRAIEMAVAQSQATRLFLSADVAEFESPQRLLSEIEQLQNYVPADFELGLAISLPKILEPSMLDAVCRDVRKAELLLGFVGFQGSGGQVLELESCAPDYLILSDAMLRGVMSSSQPLRRVELVLATCEQLGIRAILPHCNCQRTLAQCKQIGYEFAFQTTAPAEKTSGKHMVALTG